MLEVLVDGAAADRERPSDALLVEAASGDGQHLALATGQAEARELLAAWHCVLFEGQQQPGQPITCQ